MTALLLGLSIVLSDHGGSPTVREITLPIPPTGDFIITTNTLLIVDGVVVTHPLKWRYLDSGGFEVVEMITARDGKTVLGVSVRSKVVRRVPWLR